MHVENVNSANAPPSATLQSKAFPMATGDGRTATTRIHSSKPSCRSSSGPNTIATVPHIVDKLRPRVPEGVEFQAYFNDLPSTDFNNLFRLLSNDSRAKTFYAAGAPGSFCGRIFPLSSVHVVHSARALHREYKEDQRGTR
ncbi:unnamed protein product [Calypogeia fissa]